MIDIHCHILPGVDDGPSTSPESIIMAKEAVEEGIKSIIATPHHKNNKFENDKKLIKQQVEIFNNTLKEINIPLTILPGQEVRIYGELLEDYKKGSIQTLADTKYLFVEFPTASVPRFADRLLYEIQIEGIIPIIVHPERNKELIAKPELIYNFVKNGALTQVTAASIAGYFGKSIKKFSKQLIEHNLTHFIASDAHNIHNRTFKLNEALCSIEEYFGLDWVYLYIENSELLTKDKLIEKDIPISISRKKFLGIL